MKKITILCTMFLVCYTLTAQDAEETGTQKGFKKEKLFTGGNINASFFNGTTALGLSPYFGYSLTNWLDVATSLNFSYISQRDNIIAGDKLRQTIIGPGAFVRIFPINFLFVQAQFEHNFITQKYLPLPNSGYEKTKEKYDVNSLLLGAGYSSGREEGSNTYYYLSISFDVLKLANSPYVDNLQRTIPVINAGFNIGLFQGNRRRNR